MMQVDSLLCGSVIAMAIAGLGACPAYAQSTSPPHTPQADSFGDIIVTAQRRSERMQDIPVAISAFSSAQLDKLGVTSIEGVATRTPSVYLGSFGALRPQLYIRGIGTRSFDPGSESSVGVFVDEVYLGRSSGSFSALKDIERIEVLRGPQGTLYGRNTIGGAINVITNDPSKEFEGRLEAGISNFNGYEVLGAIGGPITSDGSVMFRVAGWHTERDGYVKNLTTGNSIQGIENTGGRLRLAFEPSSDLRIDLTAEYLHDGDKAGFGGINQGTGISAEGLAADPRSVFFASPSKLPNLILPRSLRAGYLNADPTLDRNAYSFVGRLEYDAGFATITSVSAYRKLKSIDTRDLDGSSLDTIQQTGDERSKQFTQELRLTSNNDGALSFGGAVDWILGAFYYDDSSDRADIFRLGPDSAVRAAIGTPTTDTVLADYSTKSFAFFGQATLHLTDKFEVTIGGRYSKDKKKVRYIGTTLDSSPLISVGFDSAQKGTFSSFDPRVVATYKFTPDISVYTSYSSGFKSGGFQYAPFNLSATTNVFYPEDIKTYEIGFKTEWLNRALRVNGSLFMYDYKDLQVSRIIDTASGPQTLISNAASSKIKGLELEVLIRPIRNFEASVSYGYLDTKYKDYTFNVDPANPLTFDGTVLVRAPKHSLNVGAEWRIPIGGSELSLRGDYSLLSTFYHEPGEGNPIFGRGISLTKESGYGLLNLAASYEISKIIITGYVKNATNTNYRRSINALGTNVVGFAGEPRIYGVKASYNF